MNNEGNVYTFELKDLTYKDLYDTYLEMMDFVSFLIKAKDSAEVVKDENGGNNEKSEGES